MAASAADLKVALPPAVREPCAAAELPAPPSPGEVDYQVFGVRQTAKLEICNRMRAVAVGAVDLHNAWVDDLRAQLAPRGFWERTFGVRRKPPPKPSLEDLELGLAR